jgi:hypothetical protein
MLSLRLNRQPGNPFSFPRQWNFPLGTFFRRNVIRLWKGYPKLYLPLALLAALPGFLFPLLFPLLLLYLPFSIVGLFSGAAAGLDWGRLLLYLVGTLVSGMATYLFWRFHFRLPKGLELQRVNYPQLFGLLDTLQEIHGYPRIDRVVLRDNADVQVLKTPKNGFPFVMTHSLVIGMQALISMPQVYFDLLVARRVGQLASKDNRLIGWLYHLAGVWRQYAEAYRHEAGKPTRLICGYYKIFAPFYETCTLGVMRQGELDADQYALEYINYDDAADGIITHVLYSDFLRRKYWPMMRNSGRKVIGEKLLPYTHMSRILEEKVDKQMREKLFQQAMERQDDFRKAMPYLSQRLEGLEFANPSAHSQQSGTAARHYLQSRYKKTLERFDRQWLKRQGVTPQSK